MTKHRTIEELRRAVADAAADWVESDLARMAELSAEIGEAMESPIEERLLWGIAIAAQEKRFGVDLYPTRKGAIEWRIDAADRSPRWTREAEEGAATPERIGYAPTDYGHYGFRSSLQLIRIYSQVHIEKYRADFVVELSVDGFQYPAHRVVIECDGHDFHERTKEQARRDRRRDRDVQHFGLHVLRFTGSEIYADAAGCGNQIMKFLLTAEERLYQAAMAKLGHATGDPPRDGDG